jgi:hypothetical protein
MNTETSDSIEQAKERQFKAYGGSDGIDKLLVENETLKKSLHKEQFFNNLLDHEIKSLKGSDINKDNSYRDAGSSDRKSVSKRKFYLLLFIALVMAAYIAIEFRFPQLLHGLYK